MAKQRRIKLIRGNRYNKWGETFERGYEYALDDDKINALLECHDDFDRPYFKLVKDEVADDVEIIDEIEEEDGAKKKTRTRRSYGKKKTPAKVRKSGDTRALEDDDARSSRRRRVTEDEEDGIEV